jgi:hypothetical protein
MGGSVQLPTPGSVRLPRGWVSSVADPGQLGCRIADNMELEFHKDSTLSAAAEVGYIGKIWTSGAVVDENAF